MADIRQKFVFGLRRLFGRFLGDAQFVEPLALGDVAEQAFVIHDLSFGVADDVGIHERGDGRFVFPARGVFNILGVALPADEGKHLPDSGLVGIDVPRRMIVNPQHFVHGVVSQNFRQRRIGHEHPTVRRDLKNALVGIVKNVPVPGFRFPQSHLRELQLAIAGVVFFDDFFDGRLERLHFLRQTDKRHVHVFLGFRFADAKGVILHPPQGADHGFGEHEIQRRHENAQEKEEISGFRKQGPQELFPAETQCEPHLQLSDGFYSGDKRDGFGDQVPRGPVKVGGNRAPFAIPAHGDDRLMGVPDDDAGDRFVLHETSNHKVERFPVLARQRRSGGDGKLRANRVQAGPELIGGVVVFAVGVQRAENDRHENR